MQLPVRPARRLYQATMSDSMLSRCSTLGIWQQAEWAETTIPSLRARRDAC